MATFHLLANAIVDANQKYERPRYINLDSIRYVDHLKVDDGTPCVAITFNDGSLVNLSGAAASNLLDVIHLNAAKVVPE